MTQSLKPLQKAIYFPEELPSGATIGYHCTVVEDLSPGPQIDPKTSDDGLYRVFVHHFNRYIVLPSCELFGLAEFDPEFMAKAPGDQRACEIRFDHRIDADHETISGAFRLPGRQWESFHFRKWGFPHSSYELARPVFRGTTAGGVLSYCCPRTQPLNRSYVLTALTEMFGRRFDDDFLVNPTGISDTSTQVESVP